MTSRQPRVVAIGDLNGAVDPLRTILRGTGVIATRDRWTGGATHVVQVGDVFNRGATAREALDLLMRLAPQAARAGGAVTMLLGNHEAMTLLGNEAYCSEGEYLSFATQKQRTAWKRIADRGLRKVYRDHPPGGPIEPLEPRYAVWRIRNVPGRAAMRRALRKNARLGRFLRSCKVAIRVGDTVFCHAGIEPRWARLGVARLDRLVQETWHEGPRFFGDLPPHSIMRDARGPLWNRTLSVESGPRIERALEQSLAALRAERMVVGHTLTARVPDGEWGRIALRFGARLVCIDVGLGRDEDAPISALVIEGPTAHEWTPTETRHLWGPPSASP